MAITGFDLNILKGVFLTNQRHDNGIGPADASEAFFLANGLCDFKDRDELREAIETSYEKLLDEGLLEERSYDDYWCTDEGVDRMSKEMKKSLTALALKLSASALGPMIEELLDSGNAKITVAKCETLDELEEKLQELREEESSKPGPKPRFSIEDIRPSEN